MADRNRIAGEFLVARFPVAIHADGKVYMATEEGKLASRSAQRCYDQTIARIQAEGIRLNPETMETEKFNPATNQWDRFNPETWGS